MKKILKILALILFSTSLVGCSSQPINILTSPKRSWEGNNNQTMTSAFYFEKQMITSDGSVFQKTTYSNQFQDNLSYISPSSDNKTKANLSAYYRFWNFILANGNSVTDLSTYIDDKLRYFIDNESWPTREIDITEGKIEYYYPINRALKYYITWTPNIVYELYNSDGSIESRPLEFEELFSIANFGPNNFISNFSTNDSAFIDFKKMSFYYDVQIDVVGANNQPLSNEQWQQYRPKTRDGRYPAIRYKPSIYYNGYDAGDDRSYVFRNNTLPVINLNSEQYDTAPTITVRVEVFSDLLSSLCGLDVVNQWNNGAWVPGKINYTKAVRGQYMAHNWSMIEQSLDCNAITINKYYSEGYNIGYIAGKEDGHADWDWSNFLKSIFTGIDGFLQVEILPKIKLWYLVAIPLVFGLLKFILGWFR